MKFTFNLGNLNVKQERNNWKDYHCGKVMHHYDPGKEVKLENIQLGIEFEMDEVIAMCKSSDLTVVEGIKLIKELGPQFMDMLVKRYERRNSTEREVASLKQDLEAARSCRDYIKERYNKLVKETSAAKEKATATKVVDDRELY